MLSPHCEDCGTTFNRDTTRFCRQCRAPRGMCPSKVQTRRQLEVPLLELADRSIEEAMVEPTEAPVDVVEDLRGPPTRGVV